VCKTWTTSDQRPKRGAHEDGRATQGVDLFRKAVEPLRLRVEVDGEGFPVAPGGSTGRLSGTATGSTATAARCPARSRRRSTPGGGLTRQKILSVPAVTPHRRGDFELRAVFLPAAPRGGSESDPGSPAALALSCSSRRGAGRTGEGPSGQGRSGFRHRREGEPGDPADAGAAEAVGAR